MRHRLADVPCVLPVVLENTNKILERPIDKRLCKEKAPFLICIMLDLLHDERSRNKRLLRIECSSIVAIIIKKMDGNTLLREKGEQF